MTDNEQELPWWSRKTKKTVLAPEMGYKRNPMTVVIAFLVGLLVVALAFWGMTTLSPSSTKPSIYGSVEHLSSIPAVLNECGNIFDFPVHEEYVGVYDPADIKGKQEVPTLPMLIQPYGFMLKNPLPVNKSFYSPDESKDVVLGNVLRSMYDGKIVIWYRANIIEQDIDILRQYAWENKNTVIVIAREDSFPANRSLAFASWGVSMSCGIWNEEVVEEFIAFVEENHERLIPSTPPPAAQLTNGRFPVITLNPFEE